MQRTFGSILVCFTEHQCELCIFKASLGTLIGTDMLGLKIQHFLVTDCQDVRYVFHQNKLLELTASIEQRQ